MRETRRPWRGPLGRTLAALCAVGALTGALLAVARALHWTPAGGADAIAAAPGPDRAGTAPPGQAPAPAFDFLPGLAGIVAGESPVLRDVFMDVLQAGLRQPPSAARTAKLGAAYTRWLLEAPQHALANRGSIPAEERRQVVTLALAALAQRRPAVFDQLAGALPAYDTDLAAVVGAMAEDDPGRALDWVRAHPALDRDGVLSLVAVPALVRRDPAAAAGAVAAMRERAPPALVQQVAVAYARNDPAQAYAWVRQMMAGRKDAAPARLLEDVGGSLVAADPAMAEQFMAATPDPEVRTSLMSELAVRKGRDDLGAAWDWLGRYDADPRHGEVAQTLLYRLSWVKPEEVARVLPRVADPAVQADAATHLAQMWQRKDPAAYEAWLASLPAGPLRTAALAGR